MIGGQVLIIYFGGEAFKITRLNGEEWGLSIGLGAISIPWGALIRMFPDAWAEAMIPHIPAPNIWPFNRKKKADLEKAEEGRRAGTSSSDESGDTLSEKQKKSRWWTKPKPKVKAKVRTETETTTPPGPEDQPFAPPLRALTNLRGKRALTHSTETRRTGLRGYVMSKTEEMRARMSGSKQNVSAHVVVPGSFAVASTGIPRTNIPSKGGPRRL